MLLMACCGSACKKVCFQSTWPAFGMADVPCPGWRESGRGLLDSIPAGYAAGGDSARAAGCPGPGACSICGRGDLQLHAQCGAGLRFLCAPFAPAAPNAPPRICLWCLGRAVPQLRRAPLLGLLLKTHFTNRAVFGASYGSVDSSPGPHRRPLQAHYSLFGIDLTCCWI